MNIKIYQVERFDCSSGLEIALKVFDADGKLDL
jgi:hypothetical protein